MISWALGVASAHAEQRDHPSALDALADELEKEAGS